MKFLRKSWFSRRIAVRVYLFHLLLFVALTFALGLLFDARATEGHPGAKVAEFASRQVLRSAHVPSTLEALDQEIPRDLFPWYAVYDARGRRVLARQPPDGPPVPDTFSGDPRQIPRGQPRVFVVPIEHGGRIIGHGMFAGPSFPRLSWTLRVYATSLILVGVAIASLWFARYITRPLKRLAETAESFGSGRLDARVQMDRNDEFGRVGATFDAMADRICRFLDTQKELLANVSHEIRTPLARLQVALELASEGNPEALESIHEGMRGDLEEVDQLLRDILTVARLDIGGTTRMSGAPSLDMSLVDVSELVAGAVRRFRMVRQQRQIIVDTQDGLPRVQADSTLLHRVVANLLDNAHKYSAPERPITLRVRLAGPEIVVSIRDRGSGIVAGDSSQLFVPFFRVDRSRNRRSGGFGLGLALAKRIVEAHGGSIDLQSGRNLGTTVTFTIPVAPVATPDPAAV